MPRPFPLSAVLAIRQQKEEAEERALGAIGARVTEVRAAVARIEAELVRHGAERASELSATHLAAHHVAAGNRWKMLRETRANLLNGLQQLKSQRSESMARYLAARSDREMLTELRAKQRDAWNAELADREAKQIADLYAARLHRS